MSCRHKLGLKARRDRPGFLWVSMKQEIEEHGNLLWEYPYHPEYLIEFSFCPDCGERLK